MIKKIFVFGNIGKMSELPKSGGQTSCRRVIDGLRSKGIEVVPIRRHRAELSSRIGHIFEVGYFAFHDLIKMLIKILLGPRRNTYFMQMTYAGALVPYELILTMMAKCLGYKTIEYLQGGLVMDTYPKGGFLHKWMFKTNMNFQHFVLFEGMDALKLVQNITQKPKLIYYPSYISDELIPSNAPQKPRDKINFIFFGRINKPKNPLIDIEIFNLFCERNKNIEATLTLIGNSDFKEYSEKVDNAINESPYHSKIFRYGNSPYNFLVEKMQDAHFYLFPTEEKAEGHSNALNEAMSQGVIPIACDYHFNKSVIGFDELIVEGYDPEKYVECIERVISQGRIEEFSIGVWERTKKYYSRSVVDATIDHVFGI